MVRPLRIGSLMRHLPIVLLLSIVACQTGETASIEAKATETGAARVTYTANGEPDGSQIFVRWMDAEGATTQITRLEKSPSSIDWSPDGNTVSFTVAVPASTAASMINTNASSAATAVSVVFFI